ncbi:hypothetical protein [Kaistia algarum]|nr:hypothetical protein [Kaistia algarum]MCX5516340.1 hypothetical protein [Kaistia algarum]
MIFLNHCHILCDMLGAGVLGFAGLATYLSLDERLHPAAPMPLKGF